MKNKKISNDKSSNTPHQKSILKNLQKQPLTESSESEKINSDMNQAKKSKDSHKKASLQKNPSKKSKQVKTQRAALSNPQTLNSKLDNTMSNIAQKAISQDIKRQIKNDKNTMPTALKKARSKQETSQTQIISFEILGFEQQSAIQIISNYAAKHHIVLHTSKQYCVEQFNQDSSLLSNDYEIIAQGNNKNLESFFQDIAQLFGERLLKGNLAHFLIQKLTQESLTLCLAESCTGGVLSTLITGIDGASKVYKGGITAYSIESKREILQVRDSILCEFGVYSEECVKAMARGVLRLFNADIAIATSGLATDDLSANNFLKLPAGNVFTCVLRQSKLPIVISQNYLSPDYLINHSKADSKNLSPHTQQRSFIQQQASLWAIRLALHALND
ncbi:CinA family protein [Helicobacter sp. MIT 14-3879]|uniref:CinA family protein n=1 Tax=Helicobacter sp. MIT 14-3879 TaxID=2040649 RepID=UPI000E1F3549|nr:CinA family protein [Helicobacter sp. MIT 14-3879]RDU60582.1 CinA family protein [Helicobacter sp. MIT 14-3879]